MITNEEYEKEVNEVLVWIYAQNNVIDITDFFKITPPPNKGYIYWNHVILSQLKMGLYHKGYSMGWFNILMWEVKDRIHCNPNE